NHYRHGIGSVRFHFLEDRSCAASAVSNSGSRRRNPLLVLGGLPVSTCRLRRQHSGAARRWSRTCPFRRHFDEPLPAPLARFSNIALPFFPRDWFPPGSFSTRTAYAGTTGSR